MSENKAGGIRGEMSKLYDVFVDWQGRLSREMPGIVGQLRDAGARRVLDVGCGTGRHVQALVTEGFDAHGTDVSDDMLAKAEVLLGGRARLHAWRLGDEPPAALLELAPFDAITCMGNVWPHVSIGEAAHASVNGLRRLLGPGGLLLLGLKAFGVRRYDKDLHMPLLKRVSDGRALWFVRFLDFDVPQREDSALVCDLHMAILTGDADATKEALHHGASRVRAWMPDELARFFESNGFVDVRVHGKLVDRDAPPLGEDVFVSAKLGRPA